MNRWTCFKTTAFFVLAAYFVDRMTAPSRLPHPDPVADYAAVLMFGLPIAAVFDFFLIHRFWGGLNDAEATRTAGIVVALGIAILTLSLGYTLLTAGIIIALSLLVALWHRLRFGHWPEF